jgi:hypothetical protein
MGWTGYSAGSAEAIVHTPVNQGEQNDPYVSERD